MTRPVVVLGAGPAGVGAAYRLARDGHPVVVLERADVVGGAAGSFTVGGVRVDHGSHRLHPSTAPAIAAELRVLLGDDLQVRRRAGRLRFAGRWVEFPLQPADLLRALPPRIAGGLARDLLTAPLRRLHADTYAAVLRAGVGPVVCEHLYFPYARKLWGLDPEQISGEQARRRVGARTSRALLVRVLAPRRDQRDTFLYPRGGYGQISEALADGAVAAGADLRLGTTVTGVHLSDDGPEVELADAPPVAASAVWSTIPLPVLAGITRPAPPPDVVAAAGALRSRALVLVYLVLAVDRYTTYDAHYLPDETTPVTRISEPKNYRDGDDPAGRTVLCAEIPCDLGDPRWQSSDGALADTVVATLRDVGLPPAPLVDVVVRRLPRAYPVMTIGTEARLAQLEAWVADQPGVLTFGRQGLFVHDNTHHALAMAWAAADALTAERFDRGAWERSREGFRAHVVED